MAIDSRIKRGSWVKTQDDERLYCAEVRDSGFGSFYDNEFSKLVFNMPLEGLKYHSDQSSNFDRNHWADVLRTIPDDIEDEPRAGIERLLRVISEMQHAMLDVIEI